MTPTSVFTKGNTALITGAASGIGLAVAKLCRSHGMKLALIDNNHALLSEAKASFTKDTAATNAEETEIYPLDVSRVDEWEELKGKIDGTFGKVDFLMLNAGIGLKSGWEDNEYFHKIMDTNLFGVINGITTFLPDLKSQSTTTTPSAIVITGSKQGITNPPGNPAYNASKAAVKTLAEHLSYDLKDTRTSVHLLVPGWTFTGLSGGAPNSTKAKPDGAWSPSQVADYLYTKMSEGKFYIICPDNDVTEEKDKKRMMWTVGDIVQERPPMSRWREEYKGEAEEWMAKQKI